MVVVILNNFPFDLSNVKVDEEEINKGKWKKGGANKQVNDQEKENSEKDTEKVVPMEIEGITFIYLLFLSSF